ncbi:hypothetical protein QQP08_022253 [Theobroma cacao]|nr:hypothetical protein QQP08_022253 [Theobroma cacao]
MRDSGVRPNQVTMVTMLSLCAEVGLILTQMCLQMGEQTLTVQELPILDDMGRFFSSGWMQFNASDSRSGINRSLTMD